MKVRGEQHTERLRLMNLSGGPELGILSFPRQTWMVEPMVGNTQHAKTIELNEEFERIFTRYYRPVSYYFAKRGFSTDECQDLAQETFLRAYRRWEYYRRRTESERGWIFTIAANLYRNTIRDRGAGKRAAGERSLSELLEQGLEPIDEDDGPAALAVLNEQRSLVIECLRQLPPRMRQCFLLRYRQGRKYKDIAEVMQTSLQSVRSQLHFAKERLREILAER